MLYIWLLFRNQSKSLKRLQSSLPLDKPTKSDEHNHRLCKSDSSLLSTTSISPPLHSTVIDSTTSTYRNTNLGYPEPNSDTIRFHFPTIYPHYQQFPSYDPTYGYYPTNNYNTSYFFEP
jgi:hypothetical protein